jgi:hypothetical protein
MRRFVGLPAFVREQEIRERASAVVPLNAAARRTPPTPAQDLPPLFLVHDITGDVAKFAVLAHHLPQAVFGLQLVAGAPVDDFEKLAAWYLQAIAEFLAAWSSPPLLLDLGGYSFGARVACTMATLVSPQVPDLKLACCAGLELRRFVSFEDGPAAPAVAKTAGPSTRVVLGGLGFVFNHEAPRGLLAPALRLLADAAAPLDLVLAWLQQHENPAVVLAPAAAALCAANQGKWTNDLTAKIRLRLGFARRAAAGNSLVFYPRRDAVVGGAIPVLLVRISPTARTRFLAAVADALSWEGSGKCASEPETEPSDYGLGGVFPSSEVHVVHVDGDHGDLFSVQQVRQELVAAVSGFL